MDEVRLPPCSHGSNGPGFEKYSQRVFYVVCTAQLHSTEFYDGYRVYIRLEK